MPHRPLNQSQSQAHPKNIYILLSFLGAGQICNTSPSTFRDNYFVISTSWYAKVPYLEAWQTCRIGDGLSAIVSDLRFACWANPNRLPDGDHPCLPPCPHSWKNVDLRLCFFGLLNFELTLYCHDQQGILLSPQGHCLCRWICQIAPKGKFNLIRLEEEPEKWTYEKQKFSPVNLRKPKKNQKTLQ